ncbi:MAG: ABC transporter permease [Candidatus Ornithospirochaeta sp.]
MKKEKTTMVKKPLEAKKVPSFLVSISAVVLGILAGSVLILIIGKNPITAFERLLFGAFSNKRRIGNTLGMSTQLILMGLSFSFAYKTGLFNIGGSGQMLMGGIVCTILGHYLPSSMPKPVYIVIVVVAAIAAGALWGLIGGFLKARFNVHEVVSSIMLNWIAFWLVYDFIPRFVKDQAIAVKSQPLDFSRTLGMEWLRKATGMSTLNLGFLFAIVACIIIHFILEKTTLGFNLKAVGSNKYCAEYAGIKIKRSIMVSMAIAGALAGLAGLTYYCGYSNLMEMGKMPNEGFDGIAVGLLGNCSPIGVFFAAIFFGALKMGKGSLAATGIPTELADTIIATIIYFTATSVIIASFWKNIYKKNYEKKKARVEASGNGEETK